MRVLRHARFQEIEETFSADGGPNRPEDGSYSNQWGP
jgi:hypothetical protein